MKASEKKKFLKKEEIISEHVFLLKWSMSSITVKIVPVFLGVETNLLQVKTNSEVQTRQGFSRLIKAAVDIILLWTKADTKTWKKFPFVVK